MTDVTIMKPPKISNYLLINWTIKCNDKNNKRKPHIFVRSTKTNSTNFSGGTNLSPIGDSFMVVETSCNIKGDGVYVILERTDIIQITNITFFYKRFSILNDVLLKSTERFRTKLLID